MVPSKNIRLALGLLTLASVFFVACHNPIMERWWGDSTGQEPSPVPVGPIYHVVSFETDGGLPAVGDQLIAHEARIARVPSVSKEHHGFGGWFRNASRTGDPWNFAVDTVDRDFTLFARWVPVSYTVTFEANGGTPVPTDQALFSGAKVKEPLPMIHDNGRGFGGWFTNAAFTGEAWNFATDTVNGDLTLYARWTDTFYTVTFMDNGVPIEEQRITRSGRVVEPLPISKEHYVFDGWFADAGFTDRWDFATRTVNNHLKLYARWERDRYTVTFIAGDGLPRPLQQQISYPGKAVEPPPMNHGEGFGFGGWFTDEDFTNEWDFNRTVDENLTLHARWVMAFHTVTFDANGGSPAPGNQQISHGGRVVEPPPMNSVGFGFGGWFADSGFTNEWNFTTNTVDNNLTLHAKWVPIPVSVTFRPNEGSPEPAAQALLSGSFAKEPPPISRDGYAFGGWFTNM
ncbi:MAG: InlB B-repeat-containing protein, partial [Treponema sp.]|nr:InlB B-repeat-containing protein [Treponema sp.]